MKTKDPQIIQQNAILMGGQTIGLRDRQLMMSLAAHLNKDDPEELIVIDAKEFLDFMNRGSKNKWSNIYKLTSDIFKSLNDNPVLIKKQRGKDFLKINWLSSLAVIDGKVQARLSKDMAQYLVYKHGLPYTKLLWDITGYSSSYTARIMELFQKHHRKDSNQLEISFEADLKELKFFFGVHKKYASFKDFDRRVLQVASKELEERDEAPYWFDYSKIRKGRAIGAIKFTVYVRHKALLELIPNLKYRAAQMSMFDNSKEIELTTTGKAILHDLRELKVKEEQALVILTKLTYSQAVAYGLLVGYGVNRNLAFSLIYEHCRFSHLDGYEQEYVKFTLDKIEKDRVRRIMDSKKGSKKKTTPDNKKGALVKKPLLEQRYLPEFMDILQRDYDKEPDEPLFI